MEGNSVCPGNISQVPSSRPGIGTGETSCAASRSESETTCIADDAPAASQDADRGDRPTPLRNPRVQTCLGFAVASVGILLLEDEGVGGVLCVGTVLIAARSKSITDTIAAAIACTALLLIGGGSALFSKASAAAFSDARFLFGFLIWIIAAFSAERSRANRRIAASERRYMELFANSPDGILIVNRQGEIEHVNAQLESMTGFRSRDLVGGGVERLIPSRFSGHAAMVDAYLKRPQRRYMGRGKALILQHRDGREIDVEIALAHSGGDADAFVTATIRDVSERKKAEAALRDSECLLRDITNTIPGAVFQFVASADGGRRINFVSDGVKSLLGRSESKSTPTIEELLSTVAPEDLGRLLASIENAVENGTRWTEEFRVNTAAGETKWLRGSADRAASEVGGRTEWNGILLDVTESRALADRISYQAEHDGLTGLLNRQAFEGRLQEAIANIVGRNEHAALAYVDLDQFKVIRGGLKIQLI